tara:strand:- start:32398 stop:32574 length:177 start_codon:yes stop_codon:yes gene_type:complete
MTGTVVNAQPARMQGVGLVRNAKGEPQFDNYNNIPEVFFPMLTSEDWVYIQLRQEETT